MIKCTTIFEVHFKHVCSCVLNESRVCAGIAPLILHLTSMRRQVISNTTQTLFSSWKRHQEQMKKGHIGPLEPSGRLTLILLTWRIWWAPHNASKWQMGFNSAFKGLKGEKISYHCRESNYFFQLSDQYPSPIQIVSSRLPRYLGLVM